MCFCITFSEEIANSTKERDVLKAEWETKKFEAVHLQSQLEQGKCDLAALQAEVAVMDKEMEHQRMLINEQTNELNMIQSTFVDDMDAAKSHLENITTE